MSNDDQPSELDSAIADLIRVANVLDQHGLLVAAAHVQNAIDVLPETVVEEARQRSARY